MADRDTRLRDLRQQLDQLDIEAQGSALTPGEAEKNRAQRDALLRDLRDGDADATTDATPTEAEAPPTLQP
ncbi:hypothetical protein D3273_23575 [Lichenibacterium minor]|uniref:Uncharacterized protein n=1 Tax=Lichenibacterium minor TaxID=2316528 RepID=A0A4V1RU09_9HYPH|nr:hypothetical protein [Lichenibacterium minor]RYC29514.1 hypothetical protein D3273_23575 [Lichenibacterium minor]